MITKHYKTLSGLFKSFDLRVLKYTDILGGYLYNNNLNKWCKIVLSDDLKAQIYSLFASAICSEKTAKKYTVLIADYSGKNYGIFHRLTIRNEHGKFYGDYCAGQDYTGEVRTLQSIFRENR